MNLFHFGVNYFDAEKSDPCNGVFTSFDNTETDKNSFSELCISVHTA